MKNKRKRLFFLMAIIIIMIGASPKTIKYLKYNRDTEKEYVSVMSEIGMPHSSQIIYEKLDNGLLKYWEGILIYYNMDGQQKWSTNLSINRPIIKTNSNNIYIIDENKNQIIRINKKGEQIYKNTLERGYKNFSVCDDNYVVMHHTSEGLVEYVTIMDDTGNKVSEIALGQRNITNLEISKQYDKVAISIILVEGDSFENKILIYDLKANLVSSESFKDNIILKLSFSDKGDLIVVGEENIFNVNKDNMVGWEVKLGAPITKINAKNKNHLMVYSKGNIRKNIIYSHVENTISLLSYNGKIISEIKPSEDIIGLDSYKNSIIAHSLRTIFKYNKDGELKAEYPYNKDVLKSFALSDNNIVVITKENVSFLSLKGR